MLLVVCDGAGYFKLYVQYNEVMCRALLLRLNET